MTDKNSILICDDEPDIVSLVQRFLQLDNFETLTCSNGKEALKSLEEKYSEIVLILLDVMMPGTDGFETCKILKENSETAAIPVVLLTAKTDRSDRERGNEVGADDYITKPFSPQRVIETVQSLLGVTKE